MEHLELLHTENGVPYVHLTDIPKIDIFKTFDCGQCFRFDPVSLYGNKFAKESCHRAIGGSFLKC